MAAVLLHAWQTMPASWALAASVHGVPLLLYLRRVVVPRFVPVVALAAVLVALLASADVGTVLLLHPPGEASLPLAIFTVMANSSESFVAALCLSYVALTQQQPRLFVGQECPQAEDRGRLGSRNLQPILDR